jgi:hypothetical protein
VSGHNYYMYVIDLPGSFSAAKGSYKLGIDKNDMELLFKVPVDEVFMDPHQVHSLLTQEFGRMFWPDSAKTHNWKESAKPMKGKMVAFCHKLNFPYKRKFAEDLENPGIPFSMITKGKNKVPIIILELKSVHKVKVSNWEDKDLTITTFKSPKKVVGVHGKTPQMAKILEIMIANGVDISQVRSNLKRSGVYQQPSTTINNYHTLPINARDITLRLRWKEVLHRGSYRPF